MSEVDLSGLKRVVAERLGPFVEKLVSDWGDDLTHVFVVGSATTPDFDRLAVSQVGQKAGADLVLYVRLDELTLPDAAAATPPGEARLRTNVRMVDVTKGRLWPRDRPDGHPVGPVELPAATAGGTGTAELAASLAGRMADRIARLFYVHDVPAASRPSG